DTLGATGAGGCRRDCLPARRRAAAAPTTSPLVEAWAGPGRATPSARSQSQVATRLRHRRKRESPQRSSRPLGGRPKLCSPVSFVVGLGSLHLADGSSEV